MLDKKKTTRLTKIIALFIALSFAASLIPFITTLSTSQVRRGPVPDAKSMSSETQAKSLLGQADFSFENKDYIQAADFYQQALKFDDKNIDARTGLAATKLMSGSVQEGYDQLRGITTENPKYGNAWFYLADAAQKLGKIEEAKAAYKSYLDLEPEGKHSKDAETALSGLGGQ